ncbi:MULTISPECIES: 5-carboxymethyl-2-hydroxymuconate Delta-isomerase [unclassified Streptomyces]|uniref:5-carboxymethyl-2-hydroxymuconate Delta-isomerase n=1 Tax=unclassified Streptomyces TaxID=2593676 RepID=UPI001BEA4901|nr:MULTISPECIES: 5-carboxymethyl-2-hydroxymuconate Delta-isomerase [unclassified Streptomyces]MBT2406184.1 5-carboxymethyl-2-hydroxymuconate Delta-isomerase [Streptomyces sp. ISL-21]MBT2459536.1 5-carboxymethyl-2-hydroxymuconate Delta-isomerase [Streptomyces sp. ISL-86]MBT2609242.1 5-carboxymethyl-2-hydroxymuconate Delta-isomerase [Streptomyces sp. ISL-87]
MPHLVLEYSGNIRETVDATALFTELHSALAGAGGFRLQDFKSRATRVRTYFIGDGSREQAFVNLDIRTFGGKPPELRTAVSEAALAVLREHFRRTLAETDCDVSVQITELDRPSYARTRSTDHAAGGAA